MAKKRKRKYKKRKKKDELDEFESLVSSETKKSIAIIIILVIAFLTILSLFDLAGAFGGFIKQAMGSILGWGLFIFPIILLILGYYMLRPEKYQIKPSNYLGFFLLILSYSGIFQFIKDFNIDTFYTTNSGGGFLGFFIFMPLQKIMGSWAGLIVLLALLFISILISFNTSLGSMAKKLNFIKLIKSRITSDQDEEDWESDEDQIEPDEEDWEGEAEEDEEESSDDSEEEETEFTKKKIQPTKIKKTKGSIPDGINVTFAQGKNQRVEVPLSFLESRKGKPTSGDIKNNIEIIEATLENFGIPVEMGEVNVGPTVTQFTLKPHQGIKLSRITGLQNDLALALAAHPIRIEAPIPKKSLVGIEVPNQSIAIVKLKDVLTSKQFAKKKANLKICLGEDVSGKSWVADLTSMPHMLIAGATGSGKSVCINNVIISLLYQYSPQQLRLIMVDPKKVELTNYNGIPHLLTPVITEVDKTINALRWAVKEMDERFRLLNSVGKRNIEAYNSSVLINKLPYIVIIIDELADLMAVAARDVEAAIVRLSQMARAVGIHLVVATQRPSVNVITGLIKANVPARIAFAVASSVDSRTILDSSGAEKLLGKGDLLFTTAEISKPRRIQGAYLSDEEIERVINFWQSQADPDYVDDVTEGQSRFAAPGFSGSDNGDELLEEAKDVVMKAGKASASLLQRRLRVGYARAARILDLLEEMGIIGPAEGAKPREILISDDEILGIPTETTEAYNEEESEDDNDDDDSAELDEDEPDDEDNQDDEIEEEEIDDEDEEGTDEPDEDDEEEKEENSK